MASTKEYLEYVMEQLLAAGFSDVRSRPMMGEYLLYVDGVLVGGASLKSDDFIPIITSVK